MLLECYFLLLNKRTSSFCSSFPSMCGTVPIQATFLYKEHWLMIQNSRQALLSHFCYYRTACKVSVKRYKPFIYNSQSTFQALAFSAQKEWTNQRFLKKHGIFRKKFDFSLKNVLDTNVFLAFIPTKCIPGF